MPAIRSTISTSVRPETAEQLESAARSQGVTVSAYIRQVVEAQLSHNQNQGKSRGQRKAAANSSG